MHPYLPHLLADIENAQKAETPMTFMAKSFEEEMEEIEQWVEGNEGERTFSYYCGL